VIVAAATSVLIDVFHAERLSPSRSRSLHNMPFHGIIYQRRWHRKCVL